MMAIPLFAVVLCILGLVAIGIAFAAAVHDALVTNAPFIPTRDGAVQEIIKALELKDKSVLYDLGCGDGRILIEAVRNYPNVTGIGIEKGLIPYFVAKFRTRSLPIAIKRENIFDTDISNATHIYCYLYPKVLARLEEKFKKECKPGTRIVTTDFSFPTLTPFNTIPLETSPHHLARTLYIYEV